MASLSTIAPNLGAFIVLPTEIRTRIYGLVLDFNWANYPSPQKNWTTSSQDLTAYLSSEDGQTDPPSKNRVSLLRTSKTIYEEAVIVLVQVNPFRIHIERGECQVWGVTHDEAKPENWDFNLFAEFPFRISYLELDPRDPFLRRGLFEKLRDLNLRLTLVEESDIFPIEKEENGVGMCELTPFMTLLAPMIKNLKEGALKRFIFTIVSKEKERGSVELVLDMIASFRGLTYASVNAFNSYRGREPGWRLKRDYKDHLVGAMKLPKGVAAPDWVPGDEESPDAFSIFEVD
ncbi:uncharacterized protein LY89DRAFT_1957 [Mollisia scopiformis]|uniref:Uncharacterized protein n=1 Tax=Mollisia scopiformis TaxID=149040 RepID=A0A194XUN9_MOLSC|nr:uncharacterized protein LY89DRAFT_1957 [Mollisia scopiformis]KUJ23754.1 hypothetical protein LY89DRAFT_1957 [Mollisia scopiformis]